MRLSSFTSHFFSSAFELLQESTICTKLDLRNAYHLVHIREGMSGRHTHRTLQVPRQAVWPHQCTSCLRTFAGHAQYICVCLSEWHLQIDPAKVSPATIWMVPENRKLQHFLEFANYNHCLLPSRALAVPPSSMASSKMPFWWNPMAKETFQALKARFTSTPIL